MSGTYIDAAVAAKMLRKDLRKHFPVARFSVRTSKYSGGASIRVSWTDGPTTRAVNKIAQHYAGCTFDGMQDLKEYHDTEHNGETVHFGSNFVFCERSYSDRFLAHVIRDVRIHYNAPAHEEPTVAEYRAGKVMNVSPLDNYDGTPYWAWDNVIRRAAEDRNTVRSDRLKTA